MLQSKTGWKKKVHTVSAEVFILQPLLNPMKNWKNFKSRRKGKKMLSHTKNILHDAGQAPWRKLTWNGITGRSAEQEILPDPTVWHQGRGEATSSNAQSKPVELPPCSACRWERWGRGGGNDHNVTWIGIKRGFFVLLGWAAVSRRQQKIFDIVWGFFMHLLSPC